MDFGHNPELTLARLSAYLAQPLPPTYQSPRQHSLCEIFFLTLSFFVIILDRNTQYIKMNLKISPLFFFALSSIASGSDALLSNPLTGAKGAVNK